MPAWWPDAGHIRVDATSIPAATSEAAMPQRRRSQKPANVLARATSSRVLSALTNHGSTALGLVGGGSTAIPAARPTTQATAPVTAQRAVIGSDRRAPSGVRA